MFQLALHRFGKVNKFQIGFNTFISGSQVNINIKVCVYVLRFSHSVVIIIYWCLSIHLSIGIYVMLNLGISAKAVFGSLYLNISIHSRCGVQRSTSIEVDRYNLIGVVGVQEPSFLIVIRVSRSDCNGKYKFNGSKQDIEGQISFKKVLLKNNDVNILLRKSVLNDLESGYTICTLYNLGQAIRYQIVIIRSVIKNTCWFSTMHLDKLQYLHGIYC